MEKHTTIDKKHSVACVAAWLDGVCGVCAKHPVRALLAVLLVPELFLLAMGASCKAVPQLLTASLAILVMCVVLWVAGLSLWVCALVRRRRGKHARASRTKLREGSAR